MDLSYEFLAFASIVVGGLIWGLFRLHREQDKEYQYLHTGRRPPGEPPVHRVASLQDHMHKFEIEFRGTMTVQVASTNAEDAIEATELGLDAAYGIHVTHIERCEMLPHVGVDELYRMHEGRETHG